MSAFSITVTNRLNVFGAAPSDTWGSYNWGAFVWGDGTADLSTRMVKLVANQMSLAPDSAVLGLRLVKLLTVDLSVTGDMSSEQLRDGQGYLYVFPDRTTEGESRATVTWSTSSSQAVSWSSGTAASTTWS